MKKLERYSFIFTRYSISVLLIWFGVFKFTPTEAEAIRGLIENNFFMSWLYAIGSTQHVSNFIGVLEIISGVGIAFQPVNTRIAVIADGIAVFIFLATLSFLLTIPDIFQVIDGVLIPAGSGFFIIKDLVLLGAVLILLSRDYDRIVKQKNEQAKTFADGIRN